MNNNKSIYNVPPAPSKYDSALREFKFRDIAFPVASFSTSLEQELVQHAYPDRDGAHVESMGQKPRIISVKAVFLNSTSKGSNESWQYGDLFPNQFNRFIRACEDSSVGTLQHPLIGDMNVKCQHASYEITGERRDGAYVDVSFIETIKNENIAVAAPGARAQEQAKALYDNLSAPALFKVFQGTDVSPTSLSDLVDSVTSAIDSVALTGSAALGKINKAIYQVNRISNSVARLNDVKATANFSSKAEALADSLNSLKSNISGAAVPLPLTQSNAQLVPNATYVVPSTMTLSDVSIILNVQIQTLLKLNRSLAVRPYLKPGDMIKYIRN